jgi:hypothetical protein
MALKLHKSVNDYDQEYNQNRFWSDPPREISVPDVLTDFGFARDIGGAVGDPRCYVEESDPANATNSLEGVRVDTVKGGRERRMQASDSAQDNTLCQDQGAEILQ